MLREVYRISLFIENYNYKVQSQTGLFKVIFTKQDNSFDRGIA